MKYTYTIFILVYYTLIGLAQYERPPMPYQQIKLIGENDNDTIPYIWYETDSVSEWNSMYNNAYNKIHGFRKVLFQDSFVYRINSKQEYFKNEFLEGHLINGVHIVKRNLFNGKLEWQSHYSDLEAGNQEMMISCQINDKENLEIIGYRKARPIETNNFQYGAFGINDKDLRLFFREYDGKTGTLLRHSYPQLQDTIAPVIREYSPSFFTKLFFTPNDTTIRYFETLTESGPKGIITYLLDRNGIRISNIDTIVSQVVQQHAHVLLTKKNQYMVAINDIYEGDKIILYFFDVNMNLIKSKEISIKNNKGSLIVNSYKDAEYLELLINNSNTPPTYHTETFVLFLDQEGNVIDSIYTNYRLSSFLYTKDQNLFINQVRWDDNAEKYRSNFWLRPKDKPMQLFKSFLPDSKYYLSTIGMENLGDYFIFHNFERHLDYEPYDASSMMLIKLKDLGLTLSSSNEIAYAVDWTIYPNPTNNFVNIVFEENQKGILKIFDVTGRLITSRILNNELWITLDTSPWLPGMYLVQYVDEKGGVASKKVMKE